jgi:serine phosphatase RsbU (regulator of sigma subunit)
MSESSNPSLQPDRNAPALVACCVALLLIPLCLIPVAEPLWAGLAFLASAAIVGVLVVRHRANARQQQARLHELENHLNGLQLLLDKRTKKLNSVNEILMDMLNKLDLELEGVGTFQQSLLPANNPEFAGYRFARHYQPCGRASGDYYDFLEINPTTLGLVVADVSGHGSRASVVMAIIRALMRTYAAAYTSPARVLSRINRMMTQLVPTEEFITMFYGILDRGTNELHFASAGQPYALRVRQADDETLNLDGANGVPLKILDEYEYTEDILTLAPGDRVILYTDGLIEASNPQGELFELKRLEKLALESRQLSIKKQLEFISRKVMEFTEYDNLTDDFTMMGIELALDGDDRQADAVKAEAEQEPKESELASALSGAGLNPTGDLDDILPTF